MAAVRLQKLKGRYQEVRFLWRGHPLVPEVRRGRYFNAHSVESWAEAGAAEPSIRFVPWDPDRELPCSSLPALAAAKCAELQGEVGFDSFHLGTLRAYFEEQRDISNSEVLVDIAQVCGLDLERFVQDLSSASMMGLLVEDFKEAQERGIPSIPTTIFSDGKETVRIVGTGTFAHYRRLTNWFLTTSRG